MRLALTALFVICVWSFGAQMSQAAGPMSLEDCVRHFPSMGVEGCKQVRRLYKTPEQTAAMLGKRLPRNTYVQVSARGGNAATYRHMVQALNRQNNTAVFTENTIYSASAMYWNLAKKKCTRLGGVVKLVQHKFNGHGERVRVRSRSLAYWTHITRGPARFSPSADVVIWYEQSTKCPKGPY